MSIYIYIYCSPYAGTIDVRRPPAGGKGPAVINMFAQWEMGAPDKYKRVQPAPPSDSAPTRERAFKECLEKISQLPADSKPCSIAFPHEIGCGLAGGAWVKYDIMLKEWAAANPEIEVLVCRWTGGGGGRGAGGGGARAAAGGGGGGGGGRSSDVCFYCKKPGHWSNRCPDK